MTRSYAVTFDYRCPFARNAHEAVVARARAGEHTVRFVPFSLDQAHVPDGEAPVWERPPETRGSGVLALEWGLAVRDHFPGAFFDFHLATFAARHDHARKLGHVEVLRDVAADVGLDSDAVAEVVASGAPLATLAAEHRAAVDDHAVFGVPTFIDGPHAVFVRFMERGRVDDLDRALDLLEWENLNELKRTRIPR